MLLEIFGTSRLFMTYLTAHDGLVHRASASGMVDWAVRK